MEIQIREKIVEMLEVQQDEKIAKAKDAVAVTKEEIEAFEDATKALDQMVAEATEQREPENADYTELRIQDSVAQYGISIWKDTSIYKKI